MLSWSRAVVVVGSVVQRAWQPGIRDACRTSATAGAHPLQLQQPEGLFGLVLLSSSHVWSPSLLSLLGFAHFETMTCPPLRPSAPPPMCMLPGDMQTGMEGGFKVHRASKDTFFAVLQSATGGDGEAHLHATSLQLC